MIENFRSVCRKVSLALTFGLAAANANAQDPTLYGVDNGFWKIWDIDRVATIVNDEPVTYALDFGTFGFHPGSLAYDPDADVLYTVDRVAGNLYTINTLTGTPLLVGPLGIDNLDIVGLAYDSVSQVLYAADNPGNQLLRINPQTGAATVIGPFNMPHFSHKVTGLAHDSARSVLYGSVATGPVDGLLITVNTATGAATTVGPLNVNPSATSSARLLWSASASISSPQSLSHGDTRLL